MPSRRVAFITTSSREFFTVTTQLSMIRHVIVRQLDLAELNKEFILQEKIKQAKADPIASIA